MSILDELLSALGLSAPPYSDSSPLERGRAAEAARRMQPQYAGSADPGTYTKAPPVYAVPNRPYGLGTQQDHEGYLAALLQRKQDAERQAEFERWVEGMMRVGGEVEGTPGSPPLPAWRQP